MDYGQSYGGEGDKEETKKQKGRFLSFKERTERNGTGRDRRLNGQWRRMVDERNTKSRRRSGRRRVSQRVNSTQSHPR